LNPRSTTCEAPEENENPADPLISALPTFSAVIVMGALAEPDRLIEIAEPAE
jgi:hypothetical protein